MDKKLIEKFRDRVNKNYFALHKYKNVNGKNKWNCICSAMDWISVSVHYLCSDGVLNITKDENKNSIEVFTFLSCIDILWEAIQQLHRVFYNTTSIPFVGENKIFPNNQFSMSDNDFFKTVRACFGAHPVNLCDKFSGDEKERRFASWSGSFGIKDGFSVMLYSNDISDRTIMFDIKFMELWNFAEQRYHYLSHLMNVIKEQEAQYIKGQRKIKIEKSENPLDQIDILLKEVNERSENNYYEEELKRLKILFASVINGEKNKRIVEKYRGLLQLELQEIYENVQNMTFKELKWCELLSGELPWKYHYPYSAMCDCLFGSGYKRPIGIEMLDEYIADIFDSNLWETYDELYTLVEVIKNYENIVETE